MILQYRTPGRVIRPYNISRTSEGGYHTPLNFTPLHFLPNSSVPSFFVRNIHPRKDNCDFYTFNRQTRRFAQPTIFTSAIYVQIYRNLQRNPKYGFEKFFLAHLPNLVFLVVCSIYKRNSWLNMVHRLVYFF